MSIEFVTGDFKTKTALLRINKKAITIDPADVVTAQVLDKKRSKVLSALPVTCTSTQNGADWENGIVAIKFPANTFDAVRIPGLFIEAWLEVQVNSDVGPLLEQTSFYKLVKVVKGMLA